MFIPVRTEWIKQSCNQLIFAFPCLLRWAQGSVPDSCCALSRDGQCWKERKVLEEDGAEKETGN